MPLVEGTAPQAFGAPGAIAPPAPDTRPDPTFGEAAAAAFHDNTAVALYNRFANPPPEFPKAPGYDPLSSIPQGYEDRADAFIGSESPQETEYRKGLIDKERQAQDAIARYGKAGKVMAFASGMVDPITLASMMIPLGGEARIARAAQLAAVNAGSQALQEGVLHVTDPTRQWQESAFNIGGAAVMGGILGPLARGVPRRTLDATADHLTSELREGGGDRVLGPDTRQVLDTSLPSDHPDVPAEPAPRQGPVPPAAGEVERRVQPVYTAPPPEGPAKPRPGVIPDIDPERMSLLEAAAVTKGASAETHGLSYNEALAQGIDPADLKSARFGARPIFTRGGASFDEMAEALSQHGYPVFDEEGRYNPNSLLDSIDKELRGSKQYSPAAQDYLGRLDEYNRSAGQQDSRSALVDYDHELEADARQVESEEHAKAEASPLETEMQPLHVNPEGESTMGAAAVKATTLEQEAVGRGAKIISQTVGRVAPGLRLLASPSVGVRRLVQQLANTPELVAKNLLGIKTASPVERALWRQEGVWWQGLKARADAFRTYRERMAGTGQQALSRREFGREVSYALRRGDEHPTIPEIGQAARTTRRIVFDPLYQRAMKAGLMPQEAKLYADSYLTRQYDVRKIRQNYGKWLDTLVEGFAAQGVDRAEARDIAGSVTRNILGSERGTMDWKAMDGIVPPAGVTQERKLTLPDTHLEEFLNSDIDHLTHSYIRTLAPEVEMTERFGSRDLKDQISDIKDEYERLIEKARAAGEDPAKLLSRREADLRDLTAVRDRLYGIYGQPKDPGSFLVRAGKMLRADNALRLLGAATLAHIPDIANVIMRYGMPNTFGAMMKMLTSSSAMSLSRSEAKRMGAALDMVTNVTASLQGDFGGHSQFLEQRVMNKLTRGFTIATGETPLITMVQTLTATLAHDDILRSAEKVAAGGELSSATTARLAAGGLDTNALKAIAQEASEHGREINGLRFGMSDQWKDQRLAEAFESAILRDAHGVTLRPGAGDLPLRMSTELWKTILQFQSFAFAASRIVVNPLLQGLAQGDVRTMQGLLALAFAGSASYIAKQTAANQPIETDNPGRFAMEVLDKSNLLGWTGSAIFPLLWQAGFKDLSRWSDRDPVETLLGPTAGTIASTFERRFPAKVREGLGLAGDDEQLPNLSRSDLHFARRLAPGQNLWYFRRGVNALEDAVGDMFDLPGQSNEQRQNEKDAQSQVAMR